MTHPVVLSAHALKERALSTKPTKSKVVENYHISLEQMKIEFLENYGKITSEVTCLNDYEIMDTLGFGSFGKVVLAKHKQKNKYYAMKILNKVKIIKEKQLDHAINEKEILQAVRFPFIIRMDLCFKDNSNLYFLMPFIPGGDMFTHLRKVKVFKEKQAQFYGAQVALALEYLHYLDIVYRDLKPENILIDTIGYVKLTDLGFCKKIDLRTYTMCGTPEYLAPEIILCKGYGKAVDWWSFGILLYEMLNGSTPFYSHDTMKTYEKITHGKFKFNPHFTSESKDLIRRILQVDLTKRYGNLKGGAEDIKGHVWFRNIDWEAIYDRRLSAPFIPKVSGPADVKNFDTYQTVTLRISLNDKFPEEFANF